MAFVFWLCWDPRCVCVDPFSVCLIFLPVVFLAVFFEVTVISIAVVLLPLAVGFQGIS